MPPREPRAGAAAWARRWWRALAGELVATALLVLLGVAALLPPAPLAHPAFAFGLVVMLNVEAFGPVSGAHMNPAVTLAALLDGRLGALPAAAYALAQLSGAALGLGALSAMADTSAAGTSPARGVHPAAAAAVEALLTGSLALLCCAAWAAHDPARPDRAMPLKLGLAVAGLVFAGGALTGASLNPARSFAPALLHGFDEHHWVYWVGPLGGAALGALLHRALRQPAPARADPPADALPLHDKPDH